MPGELRTVALGKGAMFCLLQHLLAAAEVSDRLDRADDLRGRPGAETVDGLTELLARAAAVPP